MLCKNCNTENDDSSLYCGNCGKLLVEKKQCPKCGSEQPLSTASFCCFCGCNLTEPIEKQKESKTPTKKTVSSVQNVQKKTKQTASRKSSSKKSQKVSSDQKIYSPRIEKLRADVEKQSSEIDRINAEMKKYKKSANQDSNSSEFLDDLKDSVLGFIDCFRGNW